MMKHSNLVASRDQILGFRRMTGGLDVRLPPGKRSLRLVAWAGLQDSMPKAAVMSVNARMDRTDAAVWEHSAFVRVWGPRYNVYVVPVQDRAVFTLGRLPDDAKGRDRAYSIAAGLDALLDGGAMSFGEAGRILGGHPNRLRYAAATGTVLLRWDGANQPIIRIVEAPDVEPSEARMELARRYLHIYGPSTAEAFAGWAGVRLKGATATFERLRRALTAVATPVGSAWVLTRDVETLHSGGSGANNGIRLLPSGDAYYLLQGNQRTLLVPNAKHRDLLWTSRVWPGAILANGEIVGTWRRSKNRITAQPWTRLSRQLRDAITAEGETLPLSKAHGTARVEWVN